MKTLRDDIGGGTFDAAFRDLYHPSAADAAPARERWLALLDTFAGLYGDGARPMLFSTPGRTEIGGNHTDHQHGCVLAGSVDLDMIAFARPNGGDAIRIA
jgi:galactokinase